MFYDYLFYKCYQLAKRSKSWEDSPLLLGIMIIGSGSIFNLAAIKFLVDILGERKSISYQNIGSGKYIYAISIFLLLLLYYTYKERWKKIISKYESKEEKYGKGIHPLIPISLYLLLSISLMFLLGMCKHNYWIFA